MVTSIVPAPAPRADLRTQSNPQAFRRHMARFELAKTRLLLAEGNPERAAAAFARAKTWRWDPAMQAAPAADAADQANGGVNPG